MLFLMQLQISPQDISVDIFKICATGHEIRFTSKPYISGGAYIDRQSNYCKGCKYDPTKRVGPQACPFSTLYWHFVDKHEAALAADARTALMAKNVTRLSAEERAGIRIRAAEMLSDLDSL